MKTKWSYSGDVNMLDYGGNEIDTCIIDTLANIFHLCDQKKLDVEDIIRCAKAHWQDER